jgi:TonB-dependent Receptor Plug Domain/CarboxypepD_reg-like domain
MLQIQFRLLLQTALLLWLPQLLGAQSNNITGRIIDAASLQPLANVTVVLLPGKTSGVTDEMGHFGLKRGNSPINLLQFSSIGYATAKMTLSDFNAGHHIVALLPQRIELQSVTIAGHAGDQYRALSKTDIAMRGVNNSQEVLRIVPGIVIGQHQGGGKAEQIFLRGFDADHGTDFRMEADGLPINMVSHAHGQGFADSHFIIPETIGSVDFKKGPYTASKGDFSTTGFVDFNTRNSIADNLVKLEGGQFNTWRALGMFNLLGPKATEKEQSWYAAAEYRYTDAWFDAPQHFNRINLFTKYNGRVSANSRLSFSATGFYSKWNASGQIPDRAVDQGLIGFYGAIDPNEGGLTYRSNLNAQLVTSLPNGGLLKNQLYYSRAHFDLFTNFTFFLVDSINGDQIRQRESRSLMGYNGSYTQDAFIGNARLTSEAGLQLRFDKVTDAELSHTKNRVTLLNRIKLGNIDQLSIAPYISETLKLNEHFSINAGLRLDQFYHRYNNKLAGDTTLRGVGIYTAKAGTLSPKLNIYYHSSDQLQFYLTTGKGFHSNDTRAVVVQNSFDILPAAYSADLGAVFKPAKKIIVNAALWYIGLQQEFVYSGDGGFVEFSGKTKRVGIDFSARYEPIKSLYLDLDINYAHGRVPGETKGANYIPLAPVWTSSAGITYAAKKGFNGSLRYRLVGDRPGNEDYTLTAKGYFITDAVVNYTKEKYEIGLVVNNLFNTRWKETQFATETRLKNEQQPVDEICFTPGTPFAARLSLALKF